MVEAPIPPLSREIALADPLAALDALAALPGAFLLHSGDGGPRARWSFFGADPYATFGPDRYAEAIAAWRAGRGPHGAARPGTPPFTGGLVGCWSYDFGRRLERLPAIVRDDDGWPDVALAAYDVVGAFDHSTGRARLFSSGRPAAGGDAERRAVARLDDFTRRFEARGENAARPARARANAERETACTFDPAGYRAAVERVREHIRRGDIFQANLSQRWTTRIEATGPAPGLEIFRALAARSPAPFAAWLDLGQGCALASASPERFLEVRGRRVETRPIKGTRRRDPDAAADARLRAELLASAKDRAENVMIVDVLRNDLGRVCETGSVAVPELCALESFAQVHHLASTVTGTLRPDADALHLLHACFPGGSITGAPKIRAMEILEALEPVRRGAYTGAIGYLDWSGDADWNIAIRTAAVTPTAIHFAAGGGITADSDPEAEYRETLAKAEGWRLAMADCGLTVRLGAPHPAAGARGAVPPPAREASGARS